MQKQIIRTADAPSSKLYSQAIKIAPTIYVSGMTGIDPKTNQMVGATIEEQTRQALRTARTFCTPREGRSRT